MPLPKALDTDNFIVNCFIAEFSFCELKRKEQIMYIVRYSLEPKLLYSVICTYIYRMSPDALLIGAK